MSKNFKISQTLDRFNKQGVSNTSTSTIEDTFVSSGSQTLVTIHAPKTPGQSIYTISASAVTGDNTIVVFRIDAAFHRPELKITKVANDYVQEFATVDHLITMTTAVDAAGENVILDVDSGDLTVVWNFHAEVVFIT